jgi:hypothetical protein
MTGTGKTTLLKRLVDHADRAIIVDPLGKLGHLGVCIPTPAEFKAYWRRQYHRKWKIVLQPGKIAPSATPREALAPFLRTAREAAVGSPPFWVFVDEVDAFGSAFAADPEIRALADYGRNFGVSLAFVARRPACVDRTLSAQADTLYLFKAKEPRDLEYFRDVVGAGVAARLPGLAPFQALRCTGVGDDAVLVDVRGPGGDGVSPARSGPEDPLRAPQPEGAVPEASGSQGGPQSDSSTQKPSVELRGEDCIVVGLGELATRFGYADTRKFRKLMLETGRLPARRLTSRRWEVRKVDLPVVNQ